MKTISALLIVIGLSSSLGLASGISNEMLERREYELKVLSEAEIPNFSESDIEFISYHVLVNSQEKGVQKLLHVTLQRLLAEKKIRKLTLDIRQKLGIGRVHCSIDNRCSELSAVYLPLSHYILVDFDEINRENAPWFFHELVHAVQYIYRFPLDMEILYKYSQEGSPDGVKIKQEQLVDYLRFFYEAQANWYTLRLERDQDWMNQRQGELASGTIMGAKILVGLATLTTAFHISKSLFEGLLPKIDQQPGNNTLDQRGIDFKEMIMIKNFYAFNPGIHIDFGFIEKYVRAIERAYFGELEFLYQDNNGDQKIYRDLHNKFYSTFGRGTSDFLKGCSRTFEVVQNGSPFVNWLALPEEQLLCNTYRSSNFWQNRAAIAGVFSQSEKSSDYHGGTKGGGGPSLKISPYIQPQLIVLPE